jgi:hypothetical protein
MGIPTLHNKSTQLQKSQMSHVWFALGRFYTRYDLQILKSKPFQHSLAIQDCAIPQNQKQYFRYSQVKPHQINPIGTTETGLGLELETLKETYQYMLDASAHILFHLRSELWFQKLMSFANWCSWWSLTNKWPPDGHRVLSKPWLKSSHIHDPHPRWNPELVHGSVTTAAHVQPVLNGV